MREQTGNRSLVVFDRGDEVTVQAGEEGIRFLLVSGKPIEEPVAWYGPIVMNTQAELQQAVSELRSGTFIKQWASRSVNFSGDGSALPSPLARALREAIPDSSMERGSRTRVASRGTARHGRGEDSALRCLNPPSAPARRSRCHPSRSCISTPSPRRRVTRPIERRAVLRIDVAGERKARRRADLDQIEHHRAVPACDHVAQFVEMLGAALGLGIGKFGKPACASCARS